MSIHIQRVSKLKHIPSNPSLSHWARLALGKMLSQANITLRIVNKKESAALNQQYRQKQGPTNVLSFSYQHHPVEGDIVLCASLIHSKEEWAHLVIHGILHLMGFDHVTEKEASAMEKKEITLLKKLGFDNPYLEHS